MYFNVYPQHTSTHTCLHTHSKAGWSKSRQEQQGAGAITNRSKGWSKSRPKQLRAGAKAGQSKPGLEQKQARAKRLEQ